MMKPMTVIAVGGGIALATLAFVGAYMYMDSPAESEQISAITKRPGNPASTEPRPGDPTPTKIAADGYDVRDGGLKTHDMVVGTGDSPVTGQAVRVHYTGWLAEGGRMFDSSVANKREPIEFSIGVPGVIPGWQQGIKDMKVGGKRQLVIPPGLAYGPQGRKPVIPPNATLIFDVELVSLGEIRLAPKAPDVDLAADPRTIKLAKGVLAIDLTPGTGAVVQDRSPIDVEMTIWNPEKEQFFSSLDRPRPMRMLLGGQGAEAPPLEGLSIALLGMKEGGTRLAKLPPEVAFGDRPQPPIKPNSAVIAQLRVVKVDRPRVPPAKAVTFNKASMTTTESGLKYIDVTVGDGAAPKTGDIVHAEYSGWLEDGMLFDSSLKRMAAYNFPLGRGQVIKAWDEAISTMKVGGKRIILAPPDLAYGERGQNKIPPNASLIFEIELVDVTPKPE